MLCFIWILRKRMWGLAKIPDCLLGKRDAISFRSVMSMWTSWVLYFSRRWREKVISNGWSLIVHSPTHLTGTFRRPPEVSVWTSQQRWLAYRPLDRYHAFLLELKISVNVREDFT
ncbi:hypothetical protein TNIN_261101 [Trichonephila inaurata madagascariensis]|uniref:Uncharacterized protein n=1 Tax=Trichonephila inaurata madagascariensis TaxID=2747483 RepID=A0A8X6WYM2_9ARAC|nr:hypothetical protein TNIN_261101 [Trichonephila inaurata madagascariensis]